MIFDPRSYAPNKVRRRRKSNKDAYELMTAPIAIARGMYMLMLSDDCTPKRSRFENTLFGAHKLDWAVLCSMATTPRGTTPSEENY